MTLGLVNGPNSEVLITIQKRRRALKGTTALLVPVRADVSLGDYGHIADRCTPTA